MPVDFLTPDQEHRYGRYLGEPTPDQLARSFYLDDADHDCITRRRGQHTRLGFAVQLGTVRYLGTFLEDPTDVPPGVVTYLAHQLGIVDNAGLAAYRTGSVRWEHTAEIRLVYGYRQFHEQPGHFRLLRWLFARTWVSTERPSVLFDRAIAWLIAQKILLPGVTVLERAVAQVRDHAQARLWRLLARAVPTTERGQLEALLVVPPEGHQTRLDVLRTLPSTPSSQGLLDALARLTEVRALGVGTLPLGRIPFTRIQVLARFAQTARGYALARMDEERRIATLLAFTRVSEATTQDLVLDLFDAWLTDLLHEAVVAGIKTRLRTLKDLDAAALQLATVGAMILDPTFADREIRSAVLTILSPEELTAAIEQVAALARPPDDTYYDELHARARRVSRVRPTLLTTLTFGALPGGQAVLAAYAFLQDSEGKPHISLQKAPVQIVNRRWQPYVVTQAGTLDRLAYTYCVLDRLKEAVRRRDVFVTPSLRYADPRLGMLDDTHWKELRPQICRALNQPDAGSAVIATLAERLDVRYRAVASRIPEHNTAVTITPAADGTPELSVTPLDKLTEPPSLLWLRGEIAAMLPHADLPEVLLEIHQRTGFLREFTHLSEAGARADDLEISLCAVLIAEACNIGLAPLINPAVPALTRDRLSWVHQQYVRAETLTRANARLVETQSQIRLAQRWGGGDVASADGLRFVVPIRTIHAGENPKYFGRERGVTLYNLASDQYTGLHGIVVTGTLRDSLVLLSLVLGQQTPLHPTEIMTDTAGYADIIFGLLWVLGYQFSPRISDIGGTRFWRINRNAQYGALNDMASHTINTRLIADHWDEILRLAGSLSLGVFQVESLMRTLQRGDRPTTLARALQEVGRIIKTLFLLEYLDDETYRRRILLQLNRGEGRHALARVVFHGQRGEVRQRYREGQEDQLSALGLVVNSIVLWNTIYMDRALTELRAAGRVIEDADVSRLSPLGHEHLNVLGRYSFELAEGLQRGEWRPFRQSEPARPLSTGHNPKSSRR